MTLSHFFWKALYIKNDHSSIIKMTNGQKFSEGFLQHVPKWDIIAPVKTTKLPDKREEWKNQWEK
jgi:hypothetical protein